MKRFAVLSLMAAAVMNVTSSHAQTPAPAQPPAVRVTMGDVTDNRTTGQFFAGLKVELKLSGDGIYEAFGTGKPVFTVAKDDTGRDLTKENKDGSMIWDMQTAREKSSSQTINGELNNPARKANTFTLQGTIPVYVPANDPTAIVTLPDIRAIFGKPMESKKPEISITVLDKAASDARKKAQEEAKKAQAATAGNPLNSALSQMFGGGGSLNENDIQFLVKDPQSQLVRLEVIGPDGKALETGSRYKTTSEGLDVYNYSFRQTLPAGTSLKIYYSTPKSMLQVPFSFENVPLP